MTAIILGAVLFAVQGQAQAQDATGELAAARQLYASASYEEALDRLGRMNPPAALADQVDTYRALCLLALNRTRESERLLEQILERNPKFTLDEVDVSPRLVAVFKTVRSKFLPGAVRNLYAAARVSFTEKKYAAAVQQLRELLALLDAEPETEGVGEFRFLAQEFLKQAEAQLTSPGAPAAETPVRSQDVVSFGERVYTVVDRDVIAPVEVSRPVPIMETPRGARTGLYQGLLEIVIGETGRVGEVRIVKGINPDFDAQLLAAAAGWRFQPATLDGKPVRYKRTYEIIGHSR